MTEISQVYVHKYDTLVIMNDILHYILNIEKLFVIELFLIVKMFDGITPKTSCLCAGGSIK